MFINVLEINITNVYLFIIFIIYLFAFIHVQITTILRLYFYLYVLGIQFEQCFRIYGIDFVTLYFLYCKEAKWNQKGSRVSDLLCRSQVQKKKKQRVV